jgi:hypothetical protein
VRKAAAWAIGEIGASAVDMPIARAALDAAAADADPLVRSVASAAANRLR